jgi:hypothetical protein
VLSYEIRRGNSWVTAQFISTELQPKTTIYSNGTYLIKAFYITNGGYKIESENVATLIADESQLSKNVLEFFVESDTWSGIKTNTMVTDNGLTLVGENVDTFANVDMIMNFDYGNEIISQGTYESTNVVNLTVPKLCKIYSNIELEAFSINNNFDLIPNVDLMSSVDGYISADFAVEIQISISQDGSTFGAWKKFINGDYIGQSFKMRLVLSSFNTLVTPIVSYFDFTIDMPDILESGSNTSGATTKSITYVNNFSIPPKVQITILNAVAGDDAILTNESANGFDIDIKNRKQIIKVGNGEELFQSQINNIEIENHDLNEAINYKKSLLERYMNLKKENDKLNEVNAQLNQKMIAVLLEEMSTYVNEDEGLKKYHNLKKK